MTAKDRRRVQQLFALLGSSNAGEQESARRKLDALLQRLGKTWNDLPELLQPDVSVSGPRNTDLRDGNESHPFEDPNFTPAGVVHGILEKYVALQPHEYVAVALWVIHTHIYDQFMVTPRLLLTSPVRGCGKTVLLDVIGHLVLRPEKTDNATAAAIYDHAHRSKSTLLLDEADNLDLAGKAAMRAVLNAGHRRGGSISRMVRGRSQRFDVHTPVALAAIGLLTLPLMHRSIVIRMGRHDGSRPLRRFDAGDTHDLDIVYRYIRSWLRRVSIDLDPDMPGELRNRPADNWRPLIAIADACGPEWGARARESAVVFARGDRDEDIVVTLLRHIRQVFDARGVDRMLSRFLVDDLIAIDDGEWSEWRGVHGDQQPRKLTQAALAMLLRSFGIRPRSVWPSHREAGVKSGKGYFRSQFERAWRAYCDDAAGTAAQASKIMRLSRA